MVDEITPDELHERLSTRADVQVVDIRQPQGFRNGHIPGAINIPMERFARSVAQHEWGDEIVVACPVGESSRQAALLLESYEGISGDTRVLNLEGGYAAWDYPLEREIGSGVDSEPQS